MATPAMVSNQGGPIHAVTWGQTRRPIFDDREESRLKEIDDIVVRKGVNCISQLESIAQDDNEFGEARYKAMGYLVAFQNQGNLDASHLIEILEKIARAGGAPGWLSDSRHDALSAIARLKLADGVRAPRKF